MITLVRRGQFIMINVTIDCHGYRTVHLLLLLIEEQLNTLLISDINVLE